MGSYGLAGSEWAGRTRREPIHGGSMAPSMAPTVLPAHPDPARQGSTSADGKSIGFPGGKRGQIRFPAENGSDPGSDLAFVFCSSFFNPGWTRTGSVRGREGGLRRGVSRMGSRHASGGLGRMPNPGLAVCAGQCTRASGDRAYRDVLAASPAQPILPAKRRKSAALSDHPEGLRRWLDNRIPPKQERPSTGPGRSRNSGQAGIRTPASPRRPVRWPSGDHPPCGGPAGQPGPGRPVQRRAVPGR